MSFSFCLLSCFFVNPFCTDTNTELIRVESVFDGSLLEPSETVIANNNQIILICRGSLSVFLSQLLPESQPLRSQSEVLYF